jgi:uncharacterized protein
MRVRSAVAAVLVPAAVLSAFAGVVLLAEDQFGAPDGAAAPAAVVQPDAAAAPAPQAPEAAAAVAPAKAAPRTNKAIKPRPAVVDMAEYAGFQRGIIATIDSWWESALARAGVSYSGPRLTVASAGKSAKSRCGQAVANPADLKKAYPAFYCRGDKTVYLSTGWLYGAIHAQFGRGGVAAIIAHEFGHHVQHTIGIADPKVSRQELQADCLAGIWVHSAVRSGAFSASDVADARKALRALGDKRYESRLHHGTPTERSAWFDRGLRSGDAYVCNHF